MLDLRLPMGLMFSLVGTMMAIYGIATNADAMYQQRSLGINVNIYWGAALLVFGSIMLALAWRASAADGSIDVGKK